VRPPGTSFPLERSQDLHKEHLYTPVAILTCMSFRHQQGRGSTGILKEPCPRCFDRTGRYLQGVYIRTGGYGHQRYKKIGLYCEECGFLKGTAL